MCEWEKLWNDRGMSLPWIVDKPEKNLLNYLIEYDMPKNALDIGSGHGYHSKFLQNFCDKVTGIDISESAIKLSKFFYPEINFVCANILEYTTKTKYNLIYDKGCLHHFENNIDRHRYMRKITELLADDGHWLCLSGKIHNKDEEFRIPQVQLTQLVNLIEPYLDILNIESTEVPAINNVKLPAWKILGKLI